MKKRLKIVLAILAGTIILCIGFVAISTNLLMVRDTPDANTSDGNYAVQILDDPVVSPTHTGNVTTSVAADGLSANLNVSDFSLSGDSASVVYSIKNTSFELSAKFEISIQNYNEEYFLVTATPSISQDAELEKQGTMTVEVTVTLRKTPVDHVSGFFLITVTSHPVS